MTTNDADVTEAAPGPPTDGLDAPSVLQPEQPPVPKVFSLRWSRPGAVVAVLFFALSLAPSLLPRTALFQGLASGITTAIGYGVGVLGAWLWRAAGIPVAERSTRSGRVLRAVPLVAVALVTGLSVWSQVGWQNDVRSLFDQAPVGPGTWLVIVPVSVLVALLLLVVARSVRRLATLVSGWLAKILPVRVARVLGALVATLVVWGVVSGLVVDGAFAAANRSFSVSDSATPEGIQRTTSSFRSGGPGSLVPWSTLGRQGRRFVSTGPTVEDLNAFSGGGAKEPIRVYAGLKSADNIEGRAQLVLDELRRTRAFDRKVLVVATTTGTGFIEPNALNPLEYLHNGDTAVVGVQYSYLPSWISLLADQQVTKDTSRAVFDVVHDYWSSLPEDRRPELYLFGLSLGSYGVESTLDTVEILNAPIDGAVMAGPPFVNSLWNRLTAGRDPGSPASLPVVNEGQTVRFTARKDALADAGPVWGDTRLVYIQHASDPVVFFSTSLAFSSPDWLRPGERGPDVSSEMGWFPVVTMWQVLFDLPVAGNVPPGFGHLYTSREYLGAWEAVTRPERWSDRDSARLGDVVAERERTITE